METPVLLIRFEEGSTRTFEMREPVVTIGRSVDNVLEIPDPNMSRRHCVIEQRGSGEVVVTDCNSSNGTRINAEPIVSQELQTGDEIQLGSTVIEFARTTADHERITRARRGRRTTRIEVSPATATPLPLRIQGLRESHEVVLAHERDDLKKLLEITQRLNQVHELRPLLEAIIDAAIELMAAERGFLILVSDGQMRIEIARNLSNGSINDASLRVSTQICQRVIDSGEPILTTNAESDDRFGRYKSVAGFRLRSILCVPFRIKSETFGTVYLDAGEVGAFSERDVELLRAFSDQAALAIDNARLLNSARRRERIEQELRIASQIQRKLLPHQLPRVPGIEVYGWMHAAKEVGGDYYDFVPLDDNRTLYFCVGDVSGKGVPAGMVMASARSALRAMLQQEGVRSTHEMVVALNRLLCDDLDSEMFLSFVLLRYDSAQRRVYYTGAGHEHLLIWRAARGRIEVLKTGGMVLGLTTRLEHESFAEKTIDLQPGDGMVLYTDGVTEAFNEAGEQFELDALVRAAEHHLHQDPKEALHGILGEVLRFKGRAVQRDDLTLVVVKIPPAEHDRAEDTEARGIQR